MGSQKFEQTGFPQNDAHRGDLAQACGGFLALLEIAVATIIVVGFFDAASQPLGWTSAAQSFLCACLAMLLWRVDATRQTAETLAADSPVVIADHRSAAYERLR